MKDLRLLKANEIEVRVGAINEKGATLLLYKDARVDMNILDETIGSENWQRDHKELKGNIYCGVGIWNEDKGWVWKWDAGSESQTEAVKGEASDSFKRACFNLGIGRELYTAPFTWISVDNYTPYKNPKTGKWATYDKFSVVKIEYDDNKEISLLVVKNDKTNKEVFSWSKGKVSRPPIDTKTTGADQEVLARAKSTINEELEGLGYESPDQKKAFIKHVLKKETIDDLNDADLVGDALDNERDNRNV